MKKNKKYIIITFVLLLISVIYTLLVKFVDVSDIGPNLSSVGFSTINGAFHNLTGEIDFFYKLTKYLGLIPFLIVAFYGFIGVKQLIKYKSIKKVDKRIILLGCFYVLVLITYILFEKVIINYRPVLMDGELEASYPSSHTMLALCICLSSLMIAKNFIKNKNVLKYFNIGTIILMFILVIGRTLSGVHWLTDIIGGIIISIFLVSCYYTSLKIFIKKS